MASAAEPLTCMDVEEPAADAPAAVVEPAVPDAVTESAVTEPAIQEAVKEEAVKEEAAEEEAAEEEAAEEDAVKEAAVKEDSVKEEEAAPATDEAPAAAKLEVNDDGYIVVDTSLMPMPVTRDGNISTRAADVRPYAGLTPHGLDDSQLQQLFQAIEDMKRRRARCPSHASPKLALQAPFPRTADPSSAKNTDTVLFGWRLIYTLRAPGSSTRGDMAVHDPRDGQKMCAATPAWHEPQPLPQPNLRASPSPSLTYLAASRSSASSASWASSMWSSRPRGKRRWRRAPARSGRGS